MYNFYEVSVFHVQFENQNTWWIITLEGGHSVIAWAMDTEEEAFTEQALRLAEGVDRMTRYNKGHGIYLTQSLTSPSCAEVEDYAEENNFAWSPELNRVTFKSRICIRLTKTHIQQHS